MKLEPISSNVFVNQNYPKKENSKQSGFDKAAKADTAEFSFKKLIKKKEFIAGGGILAAATLALLCLKKNSKKTLETVQKGISEVKAAAKVESTEKTAFEAQEKVAQEETQKTGADSIKEVKALIKSYKKDEMFFLGEYPEYYIKNNDFLKPHYYIEELWSRGKGTGTKAIQDVVRKSLQDPETEGRVVLQASKIDKKTYPAGFYYKLGFRTDHNETNAILENWLKDGGKRENAPKIDTMMYLPKENIEQCLNYGK